MMHTGRITGLLLFFMILLFAGAAVAESINRVYDVCRSLMDNGSLQWTLETKLQGLSDEQETEDRTFQGQCVLEESVMSFRMTEDDRVLLEGTMDAETIHLTSSPLSMSTTCTWAELKEHTLIEESAGQTKITVSMTGPDSELISLSVKVVRAQGDESLWEQWEIIGGFITGPGSVCSLWDSGEQAEGVTKHTVAFTYDEHELMTEGTGRIAQADGVLSGEEAADILLDEEDIGSLRLTWTRIPGNGRGET